jgi:IS4 transposase
MVRLITTLLDPAQAPAEELAHLYTERWTEESSFDELKTHLRGSGRVLRSPLPDLVEQEWYGFLLAYYVVRVTIAEAARREGASPRTFSFVRAVRVIKRRLAFSPSDGSGNEGGV